MAIDHKNLLGGNLNRAGTLDPGQEARYSAGRLLEISTRAIRFLAARQHAETGGLHSTYGFLFNRAVTAIAALRRSHAEDIFPGSDSGERWCDTTERRMVDERIGVNHGSFKP